MNIGLLIWKEGFHDRAKKQIDYADGDMRVIVHSGLLPTSGFKSWLKNLYVWHIIYLTGQPEGECSSPDPAKIYNESIK